MDESITSFFMSRASVFDIQRFCELNGYYLEIIDPTHYRLMKRDSNYFDFCFGRACN